MKSTLPTPQISGLPAPSANEAGWLWTQATPVSSEAAAKDGTVWPRISIVTPSFNQGQFIEQTILSVLNQGYPNLEYIIIDGGSTDGSVEIIKKYEQQLHFWVSEPDNGQYDAINKGFELATGSIMAWINSDDMYCPWAFRTVADIMCALPQINWLTTLQPGSWDWQGYCSGFDSVPGYSKDYFLDGYNLKHPDSRKGQGRWIQQESTFWRKELWQKIDGKIPAQFGLAGDFDLWAQFFRHEEIYATTSPLGGSRRQENQRSNDVSTYSGEAYRSLTTMRKELNWAPNTVRENILRMKLNKFPKMKKLLPELVGYQCKKVVRTNSETSNGQWEVEAYRIL